MEILGPTQANVRLIQITKAEIQPISKPKTSF